ncbi:hypothetical protein [Nesterenkonia pannonica]|uniref:hypothetical protein n=1 Tax=Nesterenkonia pannonica TaxID=1548602 RepID=UPI0021649CE5|nr:hypothetical protein [Nesterenkonia pannonica]
MLYKGAGRFSRSQVVYSDPQAAGVLGADPEQESAAADRAQEVPEHSEEEWAEMTIAERRRARERAARRRERAETEDGQVLSASASPSSEERRDD